MKRASVILVALICLLVGGCSPIPTNDEYKQAQSWCENFGGTKTVAFGRLSGLRARCIDGTLIIRDGSN